MKIPMPILRDTQAAFTSPPRPSANAVIEERRYLQRFNRSQVRVQVMRTWRTISGELVTWVGFEPWLGL
jgi:hypothetical protein